MARSDPAIYRLSQPRRVTEEMDSAEREGYTRTARVHPKEEAVWIIVIAVVAGLQYGCEPGPSGRWAQAGRTDQQAEDDYAHCQKLEMQESEGQRSTDPFKEGAVEEDCMEREGYTFVKNQPKPSSSRY